jgi:thiol:disulfide interchange protein DsbD
LVDFVHDGEVTVLVPVTVGAPRKPGDEVTVKVRASWLVCKEACVPGSAEVSVTLPVIETLPPAPEPTRARFARARALLPQPAPKALKARLSESVLELRLPGAKGLTFFPQLPEQVQPAMADQGVARGEVLRVRYPEAVARAERLRGLLVVEDAAGTRCHWVELAPPTTKTPERAPVAPKRDHQ